MYSIISWGFVIKCVKIFPMLFGLGCFPCGIAGWERGVEDCWEIG